MDIGHLAVHLPRPPSQSKGSAASRHSATEMTETLQTWKPDETDQSCKLFTVARWRSLRYLALMYHEAALLWPDNTLQKPFVLWSVVWNGHIHAALRLGPPAPTWFMLVRQQQQQQQHQHATRNTQHATRNTQHATRNTQHATRNTQHTTHTTHNT